MYVCMLSYSCCRCAMKLLICISVIVVILLVVVIILVVVLIHKSSEKSWWTNKTQKKKRKKGEKEKKNMSKNILKDVSGIKQFSIKSKNSRFKYTAKFIIIDEYG